MAAARAKEVDQDECQPCQCDAADHDECNRSECEGHCYPEYAADDRHAAKVPPRAG